MDGPLEEGKDQIDEGHVPEDIFGPPVIDESACTPPNNNVSGGIGEEKEDSPTPTRENRRYIQQNEARFADGYDSEGYDAPFMYRLLLSHFFLMTMIKYQLARRRQL